jgi:hypothetical protein
MDELIKKGKKEYYFMNTSKTVFQGLNAIINVSNQLPLEYSSFKIYYVYLRHTKMYQE